MKKFYFLLACLLIGLTTSVAQEAAVINNIKYYLDNGQATIMVQDKSLSGDIVIPQTVEKDGKEYRVSSITSSAFGETNIRSIVLPEGITSLPDRCFSDCGYLESITIPNGVTSLGDGCFSHCSNLLSITIPNSVTSLGDYCFSNCYSLKSITIPNSVTSLGEKCFSSCSRLESITIPSGVTSLGYECFYSCESLQSITIPNGVTSLGYECFSKCNSLESITIPNSVTSLGERCFSFCRSLQSVTILNGVTSLGELCFWSCSSLVSITIPNSVTSLGDGCFADCSNLLKVTTQWTDLSKVNAHGEAFKGIFSEAKLYVPEGTTTMYKAKSPWSEFKYIVEEDGVVEPSKKCETPVIDYKDGQLVFTSATEGAQYHYTLTDNDMAQDAFSENGKVKIGGVYDISVYASATGYTNSDVATGKLYFLNATMNPSSITVPAQRGVLVQVHNGTVSVSGLNDGERAALYTIDGRLITTATTIAGVARLQSGNTQGIAVLKVGEQSHKIVLK